MLNIKEFKATDKDNSVLIYGGTIWGRLVYKELTQNEISVEGIYDLHLVGEQIEDVYIQHPQKMKDFLGKNVMVIVCATKGFRSMCDFLERLGFDQAYHAGKILNQIDFDKVKSWDSYDRDEMVSKYMKYVKNYQGIELDEIEIAEFGVSITDLCSLKCDKCINLTPDIVMCGGKLFNINEQIDNFKKYLDCVKCLYKVSICGGEAFLHPELYKMVDFCVTQEKIKRVEILTNATIIPKEKNLECLKHEKVRVVLDDYGALSNKLREIAELCEKEHISYDIKKLDYWYDLSEMCDRNYTEEEVRDLYRECDRAQCFSLTDCAIVNCSFAYGNRICGKAPCDTEDDYVDLKLYKREDPLLKKELLELMRRPYLELCKYCVGTGKNGKVIEVAKQRV